MRKRTTVPLFVQTRDLKMLREGLCFAQSCTHSKPMKERFGRLVSQIDIYRPLANDGKHTGKGLCTETCGCEDR